MTYLRKLYMRWPLVADFALTLLAYSAVHFGSDYFNFNLRFSRDTLLDIIPSTIGTCVSLAGFILAALTIIVSFKSSIETRGMADAQNALQMIFSSKHYPLIVMVFKKAIYELVIVFVVLYIAWLFETELRTTPVLIVACSSIMLLCLTTFRSMLFLFRIINLEKFKNEE